MLAKDRHPARDTNYGVEYNRCLGSGYVLAKDRHPARHTNYDVEDNRCVAGKKKQRYWNFSKADPTRYFAYETKDRNGFFDGSKAENS